MEQEFPLIMDIPSDTPRGDGRCGAARQDGAVLFFALIALVVMTLAAIALVRSVDTASLISGNLAFKQSAASSGDNGIEAAMAVLALPANPVNTNLNVSAPASGYYNSLNRAIDLTTLAWDDTNSILVDGDPLTAGAQANDPAGNSVRYIIQRVCLHPTGAAANLSSGATITVSTTNCSLTDAIDTSSKQVKEDAPPPGAGSPIYRVTARVAGPRNTVSYIQGFVY
jgi:Tfp pilus assembly protein PilX